MATIDASIGPPGASAPGGPASPDAGQAEDQVLLDRVQELTAEVERIEDVGARDTAQELLAAVLELYGEGLERIMWAIGEAGDAGEPISKWMVDDGVIASLLLIHDLYPVSLEDRVNEALESVRPYMESHGGNVVLLGLGNDGIARLRLEGSCDGCPASASTLELAIKQALDEAAPDLAGLEVEGVNDSRPAGLRADEISGSPLPVVHIGADGTAAANDDSPTANGGAPGLASVEGRAARWLELDPSLSPDEGLIVNTLVVGTKIFIANVGGSLLAFRDVCAGCDQPLGEGQLKGGVLACPACERRFYLPRAGRSMDEDGLLLAPVPLLAQGGGIKVALSV